MATKPCRGGVGAAACGRRAVAIGFCCVLLFLVVVAARPKVGGGGTVWGAARQRARLDRCGVCSVPRCGPVGGNPQPHAAAAWPPQWPSPLPSRGGRSCSPRLARCGRCTRARRARQRRGGLRAEHLWSAGSRAASRYREADAARGRGMAWGVEVGGVGVVPMTKQGTADDPGGRIPRRAAVDGAARRVLG